MALYLSSVPAEDLKQLVHIYLWIFFLTMSLKKLPTFPEEKFKVFLNSVTSLVLQINLWNKYLFQKYFN